jgi:hypothetical protein
MRDQNLQDLVDLKVDLAEFEYMGNELSIFEFKKVVRCALKY